MSNVKLVQAAEMAYDSADSLIDSVNAMLEIVPTFPEAVSEQDEADIKKGLLNRAIAKFPTRFFLRDGDTYTLITSADAKKADAKKVVSITPDFAMKTTPHELGQMKTNEPGRHKVIAGIRKAIQTNASNRYTYIGTIANREKATRGEGSGGKPRTVGQIMDRTMKTLASIDKMHATARGRGNPDALPDEVVKTAEAAYMAKVQAYLKTK